MRANQDCFEPQIRIFRQIQLRFGRHQTGYNAPLNDQNAQNGIAEISLAHQTTHPTHITIDSYLLHIYYSTQKKDSPKVSGATEVLEGFC